MKTITERKGPMHNPPHPGEVLRELYLEPLGLSVTETAQRLGVTRKALSELLNGRTMLSTTMALRLAEATNTSPESWMNLQQARDLWETRKTRIRVKKLEAAA